MNDYKAQVSIVFILISIVSIIITIPSVNAEGVQLEFVDLDIPATVIVGDKFTISGNLVIFDDAVDTVYLMIDGSNQLLIEGKKITDLGPSFSSKTTKTFSFDLLPLYIGTITITLTAIAIDDDKEIARNDITITLTAIEPTTTLAFKRINLDSDEESRIIYLTAMIENIGSFPAKDVIASIKAPGSMINVEDTIKHIDVIDVNSNYNVTWVLHASEDKLVDVELELFATNADKVFLSVPINSLQQQTTLAFKRINLDSDEESRIIYLTAMIENIGSFPAKDVIASIKAPGSMINVEDTIKHIDVIDVNSNYNVTWVLHASEDKLVDVELELFATNADKVFLSVPINSPNLNSLYFTDIFVPQNIVTGELFNIEFTIANNDVKPIDNILVSLDVQDGINIISDPIINIDTLEVNGTYSSKFTLQVLESGVFSLKLRSLAPTASSSIPLTITATESDIRLIISSVSTTPLYIYPSDKEVILTVGVTNYGDKAIKGLASRLLLPEGFTPSWTGSDLFTFQFLPSSKDIPNEQFATFMFNVDNNVKPGSHVLQLLMQYDDKEIIKEFTLFVMPKAKFEFLNISFLKEGTLGVETLDSIYPDTSATVRVKLKNVGNIAAESVVVELQSSNDFQGIRSEISGDVGDIDKLGTVFPNEEFHATFHITTDPTITEGTYPLTLIISWEQTGATSNIFSQALQVPINVADKPISDNLPYTTMFLIGISLAFLFLYIYNRHRKTS